MPKRRDRKNRVLRKGEVQRDDGRYQYRYIDPATKERKSVYSWKLVETDALPPGKLQCKALRTLEKEISEAEVYNYSYDRSRTTTVDDLWEVFMKAKAFIKDSSKSTYASYYATHIAPYFGKRVASTITYSDVCYYYSELKKQNLKDSTMHLVSTILTGIFDAGVHDGILKTNPSHKALTRTALNKNKPVKESASDESTTNEKRDGIALTGAESRAFLDYLEIQPERYKTLSNILMVLISAGLRIGECLALTESDCDFWTKELRISKNLARVHHSTDKTVRLELQTPKTKKGTRRVPMSPIAEKALRDELTRNTGLRQSTVIDDFEGFVFLDKRTEGLFNSSNVYTSFKHMVERYNKFEEENAKLDGRELVLLPKELTLHDLRKTFCAKLYDKLGPGEIKVISDIMGHANVTTTMNIYIPPDQDSRENARRNIVSGSLFSAETSR